MHHHNHYVALASHHHQSAYNCLRHGQPGNPIQYCPLAHDQVVALRTRQCALAPQHGFYPATASESNLQNELAFAMEDALDLTMYPAAKTSQSHPLKYVFPSWRNVN